MDGLLDGDWLAAAMAACAAAASTACFRFSGIHGLSTTWPFTLTHGVELRPSLDASSVALATQFL